MASDSNRTTGHQHLDITNQGSSASIQMAPATALGGHACHAEHLHYHPYTPKSQLSYSSESHPPALGPKSVPDPAGLTQGRCSGALAPCRTPGPQCHTCLIDKQPLGPRPPARAHQRFVRGGTETNCLSVTILALQPRLRLSAKIIADSRIRMSCEHSEGSGHGVTRTSSTAGDK